MQHSVATTSPCLQSWSGLSLPNHVHVRNMHMQGGLVSSCVAEAIMVHMPASKCRAAAHLTPRPCRSAAQVSAAVRSSANVLSLQSPSTFKLCMRCLGCHLHSTSSLHARSDVRASGCALWALTWQHSPGRSTPVAAGPACLLAWRSRTGTRKTTLL